MIQKPKKAVSICIFVLSLSLTIPYCSQSYRSDHTFLSRHKTSMAFICKGWKNESFHLSHSSTVSKN